MRRNLLLAVLAAGTILATSLAVWAADPPAMRSHDRPSASPRTTPNPGTMTSEEESGTVPSNTPRAGHCCRVTELLGREIQSQNNETLGKIEDLAVNPDTGKVQYVVVSFDAAMGMEGKLLPMPWMAFKHVPAKPGETAATAGHCVLNVDKNALAKAPSFQQGQWPDFSDPRWINAIEQFYRPIIAKQSSDTHAR